MNKKLPALLIFFGLALAVAVGIGLALSSAVGIGLTAQGDDEGVEHRVPKEEALQQVDQQEAEVWSQRDLERERAIEALPALPRGATYSAPRDDLPGLDELRGEAESASDSAEQLPVDVWVEPGYFEAQLANEWQCAWLSSAVASVAAGDAEARDHAIEQLRSFSDMEYIEYFPDFERFFAITVEPIRDDDTFEAVGFLQSCPAETHVDTGS